MLVICVWTRNVWCSVLYSFSPFAYFKQACGEGEKPLIARYLGIDWWKSEWINYFLYVWSASRRPLQISAACYVQKHTLSIVAFLNFIIISITNKRENMYIYTVAYTKINCHKKNRLSIVQNHPAPYVQ